MLGETREIHVDPCISRTSYSACLPWASMCTCFCRCKPPPPAMLRYKDVDQLGEVQTHTHTHDYRILTNDIDVYVSHLHWHILWMVYLVCILYICLHIYTHWYILYIWIILHNIYYYLHSIYMYIHFFLHMAASWNTVLGTLDWRHVKRHSKHAQKHRPKQSTSKHTPQRQQFVRGDWVGFDSWFLFRIILWLQASVSQPCDVLGLTPCRSFLCGKSRG